MNYMKNLFSQDLDSRSNQELLYDDELENMMYTSRVDEDDPEELYLGRG